MSQHDYAHAALALATGEVHRVKLPPRVMRGRLTGFLFDTNKTFLLPVSLPGIRGLANFYAAHPGVKVLVTGHTDTVGSDTANLGLSDERAAAVAAYLIDDVDGWMKHYAGTPASAVWGTREDQYMLGALPHGAAPYYAGPAHGRLDEPTRSAVKRFQADHGLTVDGEPGPITRRALVTDYMAIDGTSLPAWTEIERHGCGECHPAVPTGDDTDEQANRRVEIFFFEGPIEPRPRARCPRPGCPEYPEWLERTILTVDFTLPPPVLSNPRWEQPDDATTDELRLRLLDDGQLVCPDRPVIVAIGERRFAGVSDGEGIARLAIPKGSAQAVARYTPNDVSRLIERAIDLEVGAIESDDGVRERLINLGYPADLDLKYAVGWFQRDAGLPTSGEVDAATRAKLGVIHDPGGAQ